MSEVKTLKFKELKERHVRRADVKQWVMHLRIIHIIYESVIFLITIMKIIT